MVSLLRACPAQVCGRWSTQGDASLRHREASLLRTEAIALPVHAHIVALCQGTDWLQEPWDRTASRIYLGTFSPSLIHDPCIGVSHVFIKLAEHKDFIT